MFNEKLKREIRELSGEVKMLQEALKSNGIYYYNGGSFDKHHVKLNRLDQEIKQIREYLGIELVKEPERAYLRKKR